MSAIAQFVDDQARLRGAIDEDTYLRSRDDDADVKPFVPVGRRYKRLLILAGVFGSEFLPRPLRVRNVFHGVTVAGRVSRAKVEGPEVHGVERLRIDYAKSDAEEAALYRLAAAEQIDLDDAIGKVVSVEPHDSHAGSLA